jgi:hypothetical protein
MKYIIKICSVTFILLNLNITCGAATIDSLGLPGDNLNLYGVLSIFKESNTIEEFEKKLNSPNTKVNNLDLNHDGQIDYIRVIDYGKNGLHSIVLQDPISDKESQDLAVIEVEQQGTGVVHVQVVGDEDLYGKNYIIEPQDDKQTQQAAPQNDNSNYDQSPQVSVNVWGWPGIQFMYGPSYVYWNSPWYWGYYPGWWSPWRPIGYYSYWNGMYGYRGYHRRVYVNHIVAAHSIYYGHRQASTIVHENISNHVYYGPRSEGKVGKSENINGQRVAGNQNKTPNGNKQPASDNYNKQMKQQNSQRQQAASSKPQQQNIPKQQSQAGSKQMQASPRQQQSIPKQQMQSKPKQAQSAPRQQAAPRQQSAPRMGGGGGGMHGGGGGRGRR